VKKAITHLKLDQANPSKLERLDELAAEYQRILQAYVDWMISHAIRQPDKYDHIPEPNFPIDGSAAPGSKPVGSCDLGTAMLAKTHRSCTLFISRPMPMWSSLNIPAQHNSIIG
jgi:hypothetical protein